MIAALRQRIADFLRERRIQRLCARITAEASQGLRSALFDDLRREVGARSPSQVARMERRMGLRRPT